ncbi:isochorismatase [Nodosilinea sp. AN01ver1]|uniref:isochorismatase n=1 Tax=Nodosilinea sp. AN01ver1 TaxID=3423362 RepID=UPI003D316B2B
MTQTLPIPSFFDPAKVGEIWPVPYQQRATDAKAWAATHGIAPASDDRRRLCLLLIDVQNTFCLPGFELFVGGRSGQGAVDDNRRLGEFIYRNLGQITSITATLDTHQAMQVFHPYFWVDAEGNNPPPMTLIHYDDVVQGKWSVNPAVAANLDAPRDLQEYALHYTKTLDDRGKYPLTIWPYHSMLGGIGHALVPAIEEACFFHTIARQSQTRFELKGSNPLTENYSVLSPEVMDDGRGGAIAQKNTPLIQTLLEFDAVVIAGQAKSHCVAWTVADLLSDIQATDPALAQKVYLLDDCASPVVVPGVVDFTYQAEETYQRFAEAGMHRVQSTTAIADWPGDIWS